MPTIKVEVPDGEYCSQCVLKRNYTNYCEQFKILLISDSCATEYNKCPACLEACKESEKK